MATTVGTIATPLATKLISATLSSETAEDNVTGTSGSCYALEGDNTDNSVATYVKVHHSANATEDSSVAHWVFYLPASKKVSYIIPAGLAFATGFSYWVTSTQANGSAQDSTQNPVTVRFLTT